MNLSKRFTGKCEPIAKVKVDDLIEWIDRIDRESWPDWKKGPTRPAVVAQPDWENLQFETNRVVSEIMDYFPGCRDVYRSITTVHPGDYVPAHTDDTVPEWISRVHVPIITNPGCYLTVDGTKYHLKVGMAYRFNVAKPHEIVNGGSYSRVHLMFDVVK